MSNMERYINWGLARDQLVDLYNDVVEGLQLCDAAIYVSDPDAMPQINPAMDIVFGKVELDDDQAKELALAYLGIARRIKLDASPINQGECNERPAE